MLVLAVELLTVEAKMKTKIILAAVVASLIVLPWMAFTGDVRDSAARDSWGSASSHWYCNPVSC